MFQQIRKDDHMNKYMYAFSDFKDINKMLLTFVMFLMVLIYTPGNCSKYYKHFIYTGLAVDRGITIINLKVK